MQVCDIRKFFTICPGEPQSIQITWPDSTEVAIGEPYILRLHIWDSPGLRTRSSSLLCSGDDLKSKALQALRVTLPHDDDAVNLDWDVEPEWENEDLGCHLKLSVTLNLDMDLENIPRLCNPGGSLSLRIGLAASAIVVGQPDAHKELEIMPGNVRTIVPCQHEIAAEFENGESPGSLKFFFLDENGLPTAWNASGWCAGLVLETDHGQVTVSHRPETQLDGGAHCVELDVPVVRVRDLPLTGTTLHAHLEMVPPHPSRRGQAAAVIGQRPTSSAQGGIPIKVKCSNRPSRVQIFHYGQENEDGKKRIANCSLDGGDAVRPNKSERIVGREHDGVKLGLRIINDQEQAIPEQVMLKLNGDDLVCMACESICNLQGNTGALCGVTSLSSSCLNFIVRSAPHTHKSISSLRVPSLRIFSVCDQCIPLYFCVSAAESAVLCYF